MHTYRSPYYQPRTEWVLDLQKDEPALLAQMNSKNRYGSILAKEVDCTYSHAVKILQEMEKADLVNFEKSGRIKIIKLTDNGNKIAESIERIKNLL